MKNIFLLIILFPAFAWAQSLPPYQPSAAEEKTAYQQASQLDSIIRGKAYKTTVKPHWQANNKSFWYKNYLKDSTAEYILVDAVKGTKSPAFDHEK